MCIRDRALIVGIVLTYTCILYKKDVVRMRNDYNEQVQKENNAKAEAAKMCIRDSIFKALCRLLAPILAFTADEAWEYAGYERCV